MRALRAECQERCVPGGCVQEGYVPGGCVQGRCVHEGCVQRGCAWRICAWNSHIAILVWQRPGFPLELGGAWGFP